MTLMSVTCSSNKFVWPINIVT